MKKLLLLSILLISFGGIAQKTAQDRAEDAVKKHLIGVFTQENYKPFGFDPLYKVTPPEIMEVEILKAEVDSLRKTNSLNDSILRYYEKEIKVKVDTVKARRIFPTYDIKHYFVVRENGVNTLNYFDFVLFPDGKIKDVSNLMKLDFVHIEYDWFYSYYRKAPLLIDNAKENEACFDYLNNLLMNDTKDREATMETVLATYGVISRFGFMDTTKLSKIVIQNRIKREFGEEAKIIKYSELAQIIDEGEVIGYKQFVEYQLGEEKFAHYYEMDLNYIIRGSLIVEAPYEQHFKTE